jgi:putative FmdB family regulatory protein
MPTYDYRCPKGHRFEVFQKMSDPPAAKCPQCGKPAERMISAGAGFLFKGGGFYITDYRSEDYKKKQAGEQPPAVASPGKSEAAFKSSTSGGESSPAKPDSPAPKPERKRDSKKGSKRSGGDE